MHDTAMEFGKAFFENYLKHSKNLTIVDIGSQDINGSLRSVAPENNNYIGLDFVDGDGVDLLINDPYRLPIENETADVVLSSSCFEHSEFFWLTFIEALRILKPTGLLYLNAPSNGSYHRYPIDCWRFYPDSGVALQNWGRRSGYNCSLLESFIGLRINDNWNDFVAVFIKEDKNSFKYPKKIQNNIDVLFQNGRSYNSENIINYNFFSEDQALLRSEVAEKEKLLNSLKSEVAEKEKLLNSKSWKITKPLRWINKVLNCKKKIKI